MIRAIRNEAEHIPLGFLCRHYGVSRSGFYHWEGRHELVRFVRKQEICASIKKEFRKSNGTYGSPRMTEELNAQGVRVSENTVAKYMREMGLDARLKKSFRIMTTDSNHNGPIADRLFKVEDHQTMPTGPGQVLAGDITYLRLGSGFLYLAVVLDIFSREVVGWSMQRSLQTRLILDALSAAMSRVGPDAEIIFHSDRGSQYASEAYRNFCGPRGIVPSMSRRGNCYDNAYVESWFASLKKERIYRVGYETEAELRGIVFDYIEVWYNKKRRHSALGYLSPVEYKKVNQSAH